MTVLVTGKGEKIDFVHHCLPRVVAVAHALELDFWNYITIFISIVILLLVRIVGRE